MTRREQSNKTCWKILQHLPIFLSFTLWTGQEPTTQRPERLLKFVSWKGCILSKNLQHRTEAARSFKGSARKQFRRGKRGLRHRDKGKEQRKERKQPKNQIQVNMACSLVLLPPQAPCIKMQTGLRIQPTRGLVFGATQLQGYSVD